MDETGGPGPHPVGLRHLRRHFQGRAADDRREDHREYARPCTTAPTVWAAALPATASIPKYKDFYALHMFFDDRTARKNCEAFLERDALRSSSLEHIPIRTDPGHHRRASDLALFSSRPCAVGAGPPCSSTRRSTWPARSWPSTREMTGAYVFSSGKNMGVFKAVGYPEDVGQFYRLEEYEGVQLDGPRPVSHQHARLVGRRASLRPAGLLRRPQRRNILLRRQPPLYGDVRLQMHPPDGHRGHHLHRRLPASAAGADAGGDGRRHRRAVLDHHRPALPAGAGEADRISARCSPAC